MHLSSTSSILLGFVGLNLFALCFEFVASVLFLRQVRRGYGRPSRFPSVSILKPLAGRDDSLWENLESHLRIEYEGDWEVLLGVRDTQDAAYPVAVEFARKYPERVRVLLQEGEPGLNPKINQLITLTRHARCELLALTDSNIRVTPDFLRQHVAAMERSGAALSSNVFVGTDEQTLGSAMDNMMLISFCLPNIAIAERVFHIPQIVSKALVLRRDALAKIGGWELFRELLAEDQRLGVEVRKAGLKVIVCGEPVANVQTSNTLAQFWSRHTRWAMIRSRVVPTFFLEHLLNPTLFGVLFLLSTSGSALGFEVCFGMILTSMAFTQAVTLLSRGSGFAPRWLLAVPLRDLLQVFAWFRGVAQNEVEWRGNRFRVGRLTRLSRLPLATGEVALDKRQ